MPRRSLRDAVLFAGFFIIVSIIISSMPITWLNKLFFRDNIVSKFSIKRKIYSSIEEKHRSSSEKKLILFYTKCGFAQKFEGSEMFTECKWKNCHLTHDANLLNFSNAVVVVFTCPGGTQLFTTISGKVIGD